MADTEFHKKVLEKSLDNHTLNILLSIDGHFKVLHTTSYRLMQENIFMFWFGLISLKIFGNLKERKKSYVLGII